jgi:hypothetical protein
MLFLKRAQDGRGVSSSSVPTSSSLSASFGNLIRGGQNDGHPFGRAISIYGLGVGAQSLCGAVSMTGITAIKYA